MERTADKKISHPLLSVISLSLPLSLHSLSALNPSISLTSGCNLVPRTVTLVGWNGWWMNVDDPYCEEVMELSALSIPLWLLPPTVTFSFHSSLPHFRAKKAQREIFAVSQMSATSSYLLSQCFCRCRCRVEEKDRGRWQKAHWGNKKPCGGSRDEKGFIFRFFFGLSESRDRNEW